MKNKTSVPKQQPIPPLKTDELIALLKASYDESVNSVFDIVDQLLATLLLLQRVLEDDNIMDHDFTMNPPCADRVFTARTRCSHREFAVLLWSFHGAAVVF